MRSRTQAGLSLAGEKDAPHFWPRRGVVLMGVASRLSGLLALSPTMGFAALALLNCLSSPRAGLDGLATRQQIHPGHTTSQIEAKHQLRVTAIFCDGISQNTQRQRCNAYC
jgi:hypothetical protein